MGFVHTSMAPRIKLEKISKFIFHTHLADYMTSIAHASIAHAILEWPADQYGATKIELIAMNTAL